MFFSIIIPTYNRAGLIIKTLLSVLAQTYKDYEVLIIDDGSTDDTEQRVKAFITEHDCSHFKYFKKENAERGAARNFGANLSKGRFLNFVDSDDYLLPNHLEVAYNVINNNEPEVFHLNYAWATIDQKVTKVNKINVAYANNGLIHGNILSCNGVFLRKDIASIHKFNENKDLSATEDWELWLRLAARYKIQLISITTSLIVNHEERSVSKFNLDKLLKRRDLLIESLNKDKIFIKKFPFGILKVSSQMNSYIALHASISGLKLISIKYYLKSITTNKKAFFSKRTLVILKYLLLN